MTTVEDFENALWAEYNKPLGDPEDWETTDWTDVMWSIPEEGWGTAIGLIEVAEDFGGEGQGETRYIVFKLTNHDLTQQFFRIDGYYLSFDGSTFDGELREVNAVIRPVTFFE